MSDIRFITAPIGGGKTLWATIQICKELEKTERFIVTNVPLRLPELAEYCHKWIKRPVDLRKRVRVITPEQAKKWFYFLPGQELTRMAEVAGRQGKDHGCHYVLDEVHLLFPARKWAEVADEVEEYTSQLRKLNDDLMLISQHPDKVDKNFRRNATEWLYVTNLGKSRLFLGVGIPGRFRWNLYSMQPQGKEKPEASGFYSFDKARGYHLCYNTMAGVGFEGQVQSETKAKRGHWSKWIIYGVLMVGLAWFIPRIASGVIHAWIGGGLIKGAKKAQTTITNLSERSAAALPPPPVVPVTARMQDTGLPEGLRMTGYDALNGYIRIWLNDGTQMRAQRVGTLGAMVDGHIIPWEKQKPQPVTPP